MFKYNIFVSFHCFTQYYENINKCYYLCLRKGKSQIFLCALYKKDEVEDPARMQGIQPGGSGLLNRFAVHCLVRLNGSGPGNYFVTGEPPPVFSLFLELG